MKTLFSGQPPTPRELGDLAQLLFEWPIRRSPRIALPLCIVAGAVIQVCVVVLFSIRYGAPAEKVPEQPNFYFLPPGSEQERKIRSWLDANDPSVFSPLRATEKAVPPAPPLQYHPSYEDPPPPLLPLPSTEEQTLPPELPFSGETGRVGPPSSPSRTPPPVSASTSVSWLDGLAALSPAGGKGDVPPCHVTPERPSVYQVAVGAEGIPIACIVTDPSGIPEADESGRRWILSRRFSCPGRMCWGTVRVIWRGAVPPPTAASSP